VKLLTRLPNKQTSVASFAIAGVAGIASLFFPPVGLAVLPAAACGVESTINFTYELSKYDFWVDY
jgi:hypothetical protein